MYVPRTFWTRLDVISGPTRAVISGGARIRLRPPHTHEALRTDQAFRGSGVVHVGGVVTGQWVAAALRTIVTDGTDVTGYSICTKKSESQVKVRFCFVFSRTS